MFTIKPDKDRIMQLLGEYPDNYILETDFPLFAERLEIEERYQDILALIKNNKFQKYKDDLLLIAYRFHSMYLFGGIAKQAKDFIRSRDVEIINAAKLLFKSKDYDVQIVIKNKAFTESVTLSNYQNARNVIKLVMKQYNKLGIAPKAPTKPKGRKPKHDNLGYFAHILQCYLQDNTYLKAEEGISISNQQAGFIFSFLDVLGIIYVPSGSYEIDYIRKYLNEYRKANPLNIKKEKSP